MYKKINKVAKNIFYIYELWYNKLKQITGNKEDAYGIYRGTRRDVRFNVCGAHKPERAGGKARIEEAPRYRGNNRVYRGCRHCRTFRCRGRAF